MCLILYLFNSCMLGLHPSALFNNMTLFIKKNIYQVKKSNPYLLISVSYNVELDANGLV